MKELNNREIISFLIFKMRMEEKTLRKRWGDEMPDIPRGEYDKVKASLVWLQEKMNDVLVAEYGHKQEE